MINTIKGFRGKDGPILLDYGGVANIPGAVKSITELEAAVGDHFEVASVDDSGRVATVKAVAKPTGSGQDSGDFQTDETLTLKDGVLSVNTTNNMEQDNTLPITSAGVFATVGNIEALLKTI